VANIRKKKSDKTSKVDTKLLVSKNLKPVKVKKAPLLAKKINTKKPEEVLNETIKSFLKKDKPSSEKTMASSKNIKKSKQTKPTKSVYNYGSYYNGLKEKISDELTKCDNLKQYFNYSEILIDTSENIHNELIELGNKSCIENFKISKEVFDCTTINDVIDLQEKIFKSSILSIDKLLDVNEVLLNFNNRLLNNFNNFTKVFAKDY
jgi:hypothetical protein